MNETAIGAVGAAAIARVGTMLGLKIGKEQRYLNSDKSGIESTSKCVCDYLVSIMRF